MKKSYMNGRFIICPFSPMRHPSPLAASVQIGAKSGFWRCSCGANGFMPPDWLPSEGLTADQVRKAGGVVTSLPIPPAPNIQPSAPPPQHFSPRFPKKLK